MSNSMLSISLPLYRLYHNVFLPYKAMFFGRLPYKERGGAGRTHRGLSSHEGRRVGVTPLRTTCLSPDCAYSTLAAPPSLKGLYPRLSRFKSTASSLPLSSTTPYFVSARLLVTFPSRTSSSTAIRSRKSGLRVLHPRRLDAEAVPVPDCHRHFRVQASIFPFSLQACRRPRAWLSAIEAPRRELLPVGPHL
jgi:hypothetical protein